MLVVSGILAGTAALAGLFRAEWRLDPALRPRLH
jgi:hypothetical protein